MKKKLLGIICFVLLLCIMLVSCSSGSDSSYSSSNNYSNSYGSNSSNYSNSSGNSSYSSSFTNKYGTPTTKCVKSGCDNYIASSGDTNCCTIHSNNCLECYKYIDGDAMYCMSCLSSAADNNSYGSSYGSSNNSSHECYICGDDAYSKYGSYYYCSSCLALVKAFS